MNLFNNSFKKILLSILLMSVHFTSPMGKNIIIDTDVGPDDLMAIAYLLAHPKASIQAITIAGTGLSNREKGQQNIRTLEALAHVEHPIPIGLGPNKSLNNDQNPYPAPIREWVSDLLGIKPELPIQSQPIHHHDAIQLLSDTIEQNPYTISILCIGALTNIAELIEQKPDVAEKIKEIVFMGGAFDVLGNAAVLGHPDNTHAEMNILADPHAAQTVFNFKKIPVTLVPLDCTNTVPLNLAFIDRFNKAIVNNNPVMKLISEIFVQLQGKGIIPDHYYAWDPLAAALVMDPELAEYKQGDVTVTLEQGNEYGRSIFTEQAQSLLRTAMNPRAQEWKNKFITSLSRF